MPGDGQGVATAAGAAAAARAPSLPHGAKAEAPDLLRELEAMGVDLESGLGRRLRAYCAMDVKELFRAAVKLELGVAASQGDRHGARVKHLRLCQWRGQCYVLR